MKKVLFIILLIISLFVLSCNSNSSSAGKVGEIVVDPYGVTPLSAVYTIETVNIAPITVKVKGLYGEPDIIHTYPAGYGTEFEIHGMFPESDNVIEVNDGGRIITKNVNIGNISANGIPIPQKYNVEINNLPKDKYQNNPEFYFISYQKIAISKNGYVRYINNILDNSAYISKIIVNKSKYLIYVHTEYNKGRSGVYDFLGRKIILFDEISHHDMITINNNYLHLGNSDWGGEDNLIETDNSGKILNYRSFGTLIKNIVHKKNDPNEIKILNQIVFDENNKYIDSSGRYQKPDWFHGNSIVYDISTDILYVSSRNRGILAINYSEWKLIWWMADESINTKIGIGNALIPYNVHLKDLPSLEAYRVKGDALNDGPKNQHALFLLPNGNLGMFDNQGDEDNNPNGSRYVEYKITGTYGNYTAQKTYEYRNPQLYSRITSDIDYTGENYQNLLLLYGSPNGRIVEIEKESKNILFKLDLPFYMYRIDKLPLYYDEGRVYSEDCNLKNPN